MSLDDIELRLKRLKAVGGDRTTQAWQFFCADAPTDIAELLAKLKAVREEAGKWVCPRHRESKGACDEPGCVWGQRILALAEGE